MFYRDSLRKYLKYHGAVLVQDLSTPVEVIESLKLTGSGTSVGKNPAVSVKEPRFFRLYGDACSLKLEY